MNIAELPAAIQVWLIVGVWVSIILAHYRRRNIIFVSRKRGWKPVILGFILIVIAWPYAIYKRISVCTGRIRGKRNEIY